jgi:hypothetical protein
MLKPTEGPWYAHADTPCILIPTFMLMPICKCHPDTVELLHAHPYRYIRCTSRPTFMLMPTWMWHADMDEACRHGCGMPTWMGRADADTVPTKMRRQVSLGILIPKCVDTDADKEPGPNGYPDPEICVPIPTIMLMPICKCHPDTVELLHAHPYRYIRCKSRPTFMLMPTWMRHADMDEACRHG